MVRSLTARTTLIYSALAGLVGCADGTGPTPPLSYEPGRLVATVDGRVFRSNIAVDSAVGAFAPATQQLQLTGQQVATGFWPTIRITLQLQSGQTAVALVGDPHTVLAEWLPSLQAWYHSDSSPADSVWIDQFDLTQMTIQARFRFVATDHATGDRALVQGFVAGHLFLTPP